MDMSNHHHKDPLHGVTLEMMLNRLVEHHGWEKLGQIINIRCFTNDPSIKSSLQFLRKTPWARTKVEALYLKCRQDCSKKDSTKLSFLLHEKAGRSALKKSVS
ncbi:MAG: VF530 family protein [Desulfobacterales bacterium]|nr:VF530 family protein [Desulfobacterales bacterium]